MMSQSTKGNHPMAYWDRFDICAAHWMFAMLWHGGQYSATYAKFAQLERLRFRPAVGWCNPADLEPNAREIYRQLVVGLCGIHSTAPTGARRR
jgi:hypothetical protein